MKKLSIFMAAAAMCLSASAQLYVTGANVEGATAAWSAENPLEVQANGGVYSFKATGNFKISTAKGEWDAFNSEAKKLGGAWVKGTNTATNTLTSGDTDILAPKNETLITYEVTEDLSTIKATLPEGEIFGEETAKDFYLVGKMNGWNPKDDTYKMSTTDGKTYTYVAASGISGEWKICDGTWNLSYGQGESSNSPALNTLYNLGMNGSNLNSGFTEEVTITFNYVEGGQSTLLISDGHAVEYPDLYLVGDCVGGWNDNSLFPADQMMTREGGVYTATAKNLNGQWLVAAQKTEADGAFSWNDKFGATAGATLELGTAYTMTLGGANMVTAFPETEGKEYKLTFDYDAKTVLVEQVDAETPIDYTKWYVNVIGTFNNWTDNGLNPDEEGISTHKDLVIGTGEFKIKVWNPTDGDVYYSTGGTLACNEWIKINGNAEANMTIEGAAENETYNVEFNVKTNEIKITKTGTFEYPDLYLVGDCVGGWNDNSLFPAEQMMTREDGVYTATAKNLNGQWLVAAQKTETDGEFTWNDRFGATAGSTLELGTAYTMTLGGGNMVTEFPETEGKEYKITFNYDAKTVLVELVDAETPIDYSNWYVNVIGTFNNWTDNGLNPNEEGISEHRDLAIGTGEFKIKVWNPTDKDVYYSTGGTLACNEWIKINGNAEANMNIEGAAEGNIYTVKFNVKTNEIFVTFVSGIESIDAEAADAVYYNLQGVRVDNPVNGLYIRVANGKSQKVMK